MFDLRFRWVLIRSVLILVGVFVSLSVGACVGQQISFRDQVQPLLANKCFACHGPDEQARQADLRLDTEVGAKAFVIEPGSADDSELIARIETGDPDMVMPPSGHGKPLSNNDKKLLRKWIDQGAQWQGHWAFEPIIMPDVPTDDSEWCQGTVDRFVRQRMEWVDLQPAERADERTLIRRVYFDLIGLPPTVAQVEQFVNDPSEERFERVVDQLLDSPHYGEHMAVSWLDIARFADTNGYQNDFVRSMWVWRDWVIDAYNKNMPYDQFIVEQIAGDMLPEPEQSQLIASGFNRNNPSVTEGGSIEEEWRIENCVDRIETTASAFLGLTIGCARCHDHKYDPISQREFYEFFAFFNNVDEKGVYNERRGNAPPLINTPTAKQLAELADLDQQIKSLENKAANNDWNSDTILQNWREATEAAETGVATPPPCWTIDEKASNASGWSPAGNALSFNGQEKPDYADKEPGMTFERDQSFSWTCWVHGDSRGAIFGKMNEARNYRGVDTLILGDGRLKVHLVSDWEANAIAVLSKEALPVNWSHVAVTYNGNAKASGFKIYVNGKPVSTTTERDSLTGTTVTEVPFKIGQRSQSSRLRGKISVFKLYDVALTREQVALNMKKELVTHVDQVANTSLDVLIDAAAIEYLRQSNEVLAAIAKLVASRKKLLKSQQTTMVMRERDGDYRPTWRLNRGQYDQPDKEIDLWPGIPKALPPLSAEQSKNRLGLARWLVDERNPLVARVIVNRTWQKFFGRGLVETPDNFGVQGSPPSHPKLLDWLADDFRTHGWDLKRLHRQIVLSATYQQSSATSAEKYERDRDNRWLSRGPRYRLSAEQIRDSALLISGLLNKKIGGPSVYPYQPDGLWDELAGGANNGPYRLSDETGLYRRSLYTYRKRTVPHPTTSTFDAPSWEKCLVKRANTNTPLQALALLNDTTYVEAARKFAERILREEGKTVDQQINFAVQIAMSRSATDVEQTTLKQSYQYYLKYYEVHLDEAKKLLAVGKSSIDGTEFAKLAAMTSIASVILNLDATITKE